MYKAYLDDELIYMPTDAEAVIINPKLELALNKSGSFTFELPCTNPLYSSVHELTSRVRVERDATAVFYGRVVSVEQDFYGTKSVTAEGELAYLLDSIQPPKRYQNYTMRGFLSALLTTHNQSVEADKTFTLGMVTVTDTNDSLYRYTNWESTLDVLQDKLIDTLGGYFRVRHVGTTRYLDYIKDYGNTNTQTISFGENLLDYTDNLDASDVATRIIPLGARLDESPIEGLEAYTTIESVASGKNYVESTTTQKTYGIVTRVVNFDDVTVPANLKKKGEAYLTDTQFADTSITAKAIDLNMTDSTFEAIKLGDSIRVISKPHGLDRYFPVSSLTLYLDAPEQNEITLGTSVKAGLAERSTSENRTLIAKIDSLPAQSDTLRMAKDNATALITAATTGHVVTRPEEILIMDTADKTTATKIWRWNLNGLGYSKSGYSGTYGTAITMNGAIVADYITTGTLTADVIKAGTIKDKASNISWNMATGALTAKSLSINSTNFKLTTSGYITATNATLSGSLTTTSGKQKVVINNGRMAITYNSKELGLIGGNQMSGDTSKCGLNFDLEYTGDYMTWAAQPSSGTNYDMKLTYARSSFSNFTGSALNAGCDLDMHYYKIKNVSWDPAGCNGTCNFVCIKAVNSNGTVQTWSNGNKMQFKNGLLISGTFS